MRNTLILFGSSLSLGLTSQSLKAANEETVTAYLDAYYAYNFNRPSPRHSPRTSVADPNSAPYKGFTPGGTQLRNFDVQDNQLTLALAEITYKRSLENLSLKIELVTGDSTEMMHLSPSGVDETSKHIGQAIVSYTLSSIPSLTFHIGKMLSHVGWEGAKAKDNWNYSRSLLYSLAVPYWHNGISVSWAALANVLNANFYVYNGWNAMNDTNRGKTLGVQLSYTPVSGLSFTYNAIGGAEQEENEKDKKIVHDFIVVWTAHEKIALAADWVLGSEEDAVIDPNTNEASVAQWSALQINLKYSPSETFSLSPRLESYWDGDGYTTGASQTIREATLTAAWRVRPEFELRLEGREDLASRKTYRKDQVDVDKQSTLSVSTLVML